MMITLGRFVCAGVLAAAFLLQPSAGHAQTLSEGEASQPSLFQPSVDIGIFGGLLILRDRHEFYDPTASVHRAIERPALELGIRARFLPLVYGGIELEGLWAPAESTAGEEVTLLGIRGHALLRYPAVVSPFILGGFGSMGRHNRPSDYDLVGHFGAGAEYATEGGLVLRADVRMLLAPEAFEPEGATTHLETLLGVSYRFDSEDRETEPPRDSDGDSFWDSADQCPHTPGVAPDGCPPADSDNDGIVDPDDSCPQQPETVNEFEDQDGCPDELPDQDGDGLVDREDRCPTNAEDEDGFEDQDGCPDLDNDGDGVTDAQDQCPGEAGPPENRGCPDNDRDDDGVVDRLDNCPDEPGTKENQGCKKKQLVVIAQDKIQILDKVFFATGKARIQRRSYPLLNNIAAVLNAHPEIEKVIVEGHTDDRGPDDLNTQLSQARANAVVQYLLERGVSADRLQAKGYGEAQPIEPNETREGRSANRRVEFKVVRGQRTAPVVQPADAGSAPPAPPASQP